MNTEANKRLTDSIKSFTFSEFDDKSLSGLIAEIAQKYPDNVAIDSLYRQMTYRTLDELSNRVADYLIAECGNKTQPIAILIQDPFDFNVAILGTLKAGKFYVPLDINYPEDRTAFILESSGVDILLTDSIYNQTESKLSKPRTCNINEILSADIKSQTKPTVSSDAPAYLIYTSGSTGKPKGVVQSHRNIIHNSIMQKNAYALSESDRFSQLFSPGVMGAVRATYNAFLNGATLCPFDVKAEGFSVLADWLIGIRLTILHMPSSLFRGFVGAMRDEKIYQGIRLVILGGESATDVDFDLYKQCFPESALFCTGLGSTETCTVRMLLLGKDSNPKFRHGNLPLGYAVHGANITLVDDYGHEVEQGEVGEICVSSQYLALGYWDDYAKTWDKFEDDLCIKSNKRYLMGDLGVLENDGCLVHLGRKDFQVKIRGNRVELKEVEVAIKDIVGISDVVVCPWKDSNGSNELCAYIVLDPNAGLSEKKIRDSLTQRIPAYMIPSVFGFLSEIPLTHTNKVDYQKLPKVDELMLIGLSDVNREVASEYFEISDDDIAIRTLVADSLENASVITFTRNKLRGDFINGLSDIKIEALNLDSLSIMEFCIDIELKANVSISPEELLEIETLNELVKRLKE